MALIMKVFSVIFKENGKSYYFIGEDNFVIGNNVIVETEKGLQYGKINKNDHALRSTPCVSSS